MDISERVEALERQHAELGRGLAEVKEAMQQEEWWSGESLGNGYTLLRRNDGFAVSVPDSLIVQLPVSTRTVQERDAAVMALEAVLASIGTTMFQVDVSRARATLRSIKEGRVE